MTPSEIPVRRSGSSEGAQPALWRVVALGLCAAAVTLAVSTHPLRWFLRAPLFVVGMAFGIATLVTGSARAGSSSSLRRAAVAATQLLLACALASLVLRYLWSNAWPYFEFDPVHFGRLWKLRPWIIAHIVCGFLALLIGPLQLWPLVRTRALAAHRWLGRLYVGAVLVAGIAALRLAPGIPEFEGGRRTGFSMGLLAVAWLGTTALGLWEIRRRRLAAHRRWMLRSYAVTLAFVNIRWLADLPWLTRLGPPHLVIPLIVLASWTIPLLALECFFRRPPSGEMSPEIASRDGREDC